MKTHVYSLVLWFVSALLCITTQAQEYTYIPMVKSGVQIWTDDYWDPVGRYYFRRFALTDEDTIIENEAYKKLYFFSDSDFNQSVAQCIGGLRENEQKQIFYKGGRINGGNVYSGIICDFSLNIGDHFSIYDYVFLIYSIDTIEISGISRRVFSSILAIDSIRNNPTIVGTWIEGIGNKQGLLYDIYKNLTYDEGGGVNRCYEYNGELQYHNYENGYGIEDCYSPLLGLNDIEKKDNTISIYPNPASELITISSDNIISYLEIYNPLGQKVYQTKVNTKSKSIDINSFSKGIYIIGVNTDKGYIKKKLVKN